MSNENKIFVSDIKKKHADKGQHLVNGIGRESERYKLMALGRSDLEHDTEEAHQRIRVFLGEKYQAYVLEGKKPNELFDDTDGGEESRKRLIAFQTDFYQKSMKLVEVTKDLRKVHTEIYKLRRQRAKFSEKMFKTYKLHRQKTYTFDFKGLKIYEVKPQIPEGAKPKTK